MMSMAGMISAPRARPPLATVASSVPIWWTGGHWATSARNGSLVFNARTTKAIGARTYRYGRTFVLLSGAWTSLVMYRYAGVRSRKTIDRLVSRTGRSLARTARGVKPARVSPGTYLARGSREPATSGTFHS